MRSASAIAGGLIREIGDVTLPAGVRRSRLYRNLVDSTLRFLIEQVGQVEGAYPGEAALAQDFIARRTAGNGLEFIGILAFSASPVWVMAALADVSGTGRQLIREIAESLQEQGLLAPETRFESMDQILDGLESTSERLAGTFNTPPLDVAGLRAEWRAIREHAARIPPRNLPSTAALEAQWRELKATAASQQRSVLEVSALLALSAIRNLPDNVRWLSRCAAGAARTAGSFTASALLGHYSEALRQIRAEGYFSYWVKEFRPYLKAAASQFSPSRQSLTEKMLEK